MPARDRSPFSDVRAVTAPVVENAAREERPARPEGEDRERSEHDPDGLRTDAGSALGGGRPVCVRDERLEKLEQGFGRGPRILGHLRKVAANLSICSGIATILDVSVDLAKLGEKGSLPVARRGYDRAATDELLETARNMLRDLIAERDAALERVAELEARLGVYEQGFTETVLAAIRRRPDSEGAAPAPPDAVG